MLSIFKRAEILVARGVSRGGVMLALAKEYKVGLQTAANITDWAIAKARRKV